MTIDLKTVFSKVASLKNHKVATLAVVIGLALSFYGGMQYQSYLIRKAITDAVSGFGKAFTQGIANGVADTSAAKSSDATATTGAGTIQNKLNDEVTVELVSKDFQTVQYQDYNTFKLKLTNKTDKAIKGVQGTLTFMDIFDNEIKTVTVSYDDGLAVGEAKTWEGSVNYNQFMDEDKKLKMTDFKSLKYRWDANAIVYQDGSKDTK